MFAKLNEFGGITRLKATIHEWHETGANAFTEPYGFTGKEYEKDLGITYFGARFYNPQTTRWLSPDPLYLVLTAKNAEKDQNVYQYGANNPWKFVDPTGMEEKNTNLNNSFKDMRGSKYKRVRDIGNDIRNNGTSAYLKNAKKAVTGIKELIKEYSWASWLTPELILAGIMMESGGNTKKMNKDKNKGDNVTYGVLQIHKSVVSELMKNHRELAEAVYQVMGKNKTTLLNERIVSKILNNFKANVLIFSYMMTFTYRKWIIKRYGFKPFYNKRLRYSGNWKWKRKVSGNKINGFIDKMSGKKRAALFFSIHNSSIGAFDRLISNRDFMNDPVNYGKNIGMKSSKASVIAYKNSILDLAKIFKKNKVFK